MTERPGPVSAAPPEMLAGMVLGFLIGLAVSEALPWRR